MFSTLSNFRTEDWEKIFSNINIPISYIDRDYRYVFVSRGYINYFGFEENQIIGKTAIDLFNLEVFNRNIKPKIDKCFLGESNTYTDSYISKDNRNIIFEVTYCPYYDTQKKVVGAIVIINDLTDKIMLRNNTLIIEKVFSNNSFGVILSSIEDGRILKINNYCLKLLGNDRKEEVINSSFVELRIFGENYRGELVKLLKKDRFLYEHEIYFRNRKNEEKYVVFNSEILNYENEEVIFTTVIDISEYRNIEKLLNKTLSRFNETEQLALIGSWEWDIKTNQFNLSNEVYRIYDLTKGQQNPSLETFDSLIHPDDLDDVLLKRSHWVNERNNIDIKHRIILHNKQIKHIHQRSTLVFNDFGDVTRIIGTVQDITEQVQKDIELDEYKRQLSSVIMSTPITLWNIDKTGTILFCEGKALAKLGIKPGEQVGKSVFELYEDDLEWLEQIQRGLSGEEFVSFRHFGGRYWNNFFLPRYNQNKNVCGLVGISIDITEQKLFEEELIRAKNEAEKANSLKTQFLANMSHELRTPLNAIIGFSQLFNFELLSDDIKEYPKIIYDAGSHLLRLINEILELSRIETGNIDLQTELIVLKEAMDELKQFINPQLKKKNLKFKYDICQNVPEEIFSDNTKLKQVLLNLLSNAIKFSNSGTILLKISRYNETHLLFMVRDKGVGIPEDNLQIIFEPFEQVDKAFSRSLGGFGLGLSITKNLVKTLGGKIWVESELNKGSKFYFTINITNVK